MSGIFQYFAEQAYFGPEHGAVHRRGQRPRPGRIYELRRLGTCAHEGALTRGTKEGDLAKSRARFRDDGGAPPINST